MKKFIPLLRRVFSCQRGIALIEFSIVLPFLIVLLFGGVELSRYILINLKLDKAGFLISDILSQSNQAKTSWISCALTKTGISEIEVNAAMDQFNDIMAPFSDPAREVVIVTSISRVSSQTIINWRISGGGTLTAGVTSVINSAAPENICCRNDIATPAADIKTQLDVLPDGQNIIVSEVFYNYEPILQKILNTSGISIPPKLMTRQVLIRARYGSLNDIHDTYAPTEPAKPGGC